MENFLKIQQEYLNATSGEVASEKLRALKKIVEGDPEKYGMAFLELSNLKLNELKEINIKASLEEVSEFISLSYVAKKYFNKSKEWLYQRINGYTVNGKPAQFTNEEIGTLNYALQDLSKKIGSVKFQ